MSSGTFAFFGVVAVAGALFATKPTSAEVERLVEDLVKTEIVQTKAQKDNPIGNLVALGCKFGPDECYQLLRQGMRINYQDMLVVARVSVQSGRKKPLECVGVLTQLYCPGFLNKT